MLEENNIKFIGPSSKLIKMMGDKIEAKKIAKQHGLPIIEGSDGGIFGLGTECYILAIKALQSLMKNGN